MNKNFDLGALVGGAALLGLAGLTGYASFANAEEAKKFRDEHSSEIREVISNATFKLDRLSCQSEATELLDEAENIYNHSGGNTIRDAYNKVCEIASLIERKKESELLRMYYEKKLAKAEETSRKITSNVDPIGISFGSSFDAHQYLTDLGYKLYGDVYVKGSSSVKVERNNYRSTIVSAR